METNCTENSVTKSAYSLFQKRWLGKESIYSRYAFVSIDDYSNWGVMQIIINTEKLDYEAK